MTTIFIYYYYYLGDDPIKADVVTGQLLLSKRIMYNLITIIISASIHTYRNEMMTPIENGNSSEII